MTVPPSITGWWRCCECSRDVNPAIHASECPDCGHEMCDYSCSWAHTDLPRGIPPTIPPRALPFEVKVTPSNYSRHAPEVEAQNPGWDTDLSSNPRHGDIPGRRGSLDNISTVSAASSFNSIAESAFSGMTASSKSSITGPQGASERLATMLLEHADINSLCFEAVSKVTIEKFERNLRRLLKLLSADLQAEATLAKERKVSRFVRLLARNSAHLICNELHMDGEDSTSKTKGVVSDDSNSEGPDDELADLVEFESFILKSRAFEKFTTSLRSFVRPAEKSGPGDERQDTIISTSELDNDSFASWRSLDFRTIKYFFVQAKKRILQPPVREGMKRVEWNCSCGASLYDDYEELMPDAAEEFEEFLRSSSGRIKPRQHVGTGNRGPNLMQGIRYLPLTVMGLVRSVSQKSPVVQVTELPSFELQSNLGEQSESSHPHFTEALHLLICMNDGIGASVVRLQQLSIHDIDSDQKLFGVLRQMYTSLRQRWWSFLSLWTLKRINFVHFDTYEKYLVDIRELHVIPPVEQSSYVHERTKLKPPIGSNLLMHYIRCPQDATMRSPCLGKLPKKLGGRLVVCPIKGVSPGWGLQFVEGWNWKKILIGSFFSFVAATVTVAALCWHFGQNIQNAFAIASLMMACFTLGVGALQAWFNMV